MQAFTKKFMIAILSLFLGVAVIGCNGDQTTEVVTPNDSKLPELSNADGVFLESGDISLTYNELYTEVKKNDGLNQLLNMVDMDLLSTYLSAVTPAEIEEKIVQLTYGTTDEEIIADYTAEQLSDAEISFENSMYLLGYTDETTINDYVRLVCARENYTVEQMTSEDNSEEPWFAGASSVADWYELQYKPAINSIKIRFMSESDAKTVLRDFNLVSKDGELRLYTGETPLEEVPSSQIDETNSRALDDSEVLEQFILVYNYIYSEIKDEIPVGSTLEDLKQLEDLTLEYDDVSEASAVLSAFMFETLGNYEDYTNGDSDTLYYSYEPLKYYGSSDTSYYMILNLSAVEKVDVEDFDGSEADLVALIGQDLYDELQQEIIDLSLSQDSFISNRMLELRAENDFMIYDYYLASDYSNLDADFEINEDGHEVNVATYGTTAITADDLFEYSIGYNLAMYTIYALQNKVIVASHFEDVYCVEGETCEYDVVANTSDAMNSHRETLDSLELQFNDSYYASYYTFDEYLYLAYGVKSKVEMLEKYYVQSTLQPYFIYDEIIADDYAVVRELMDMYQPYYDNYFSLNIQHILIYVDRDENTIPDDYEEFYNDLTEAEKTVYDAKLVDFETAIRLYLEDEENTMMSLVSDYTKATRDDETWGTYKTSGFYLLTETLGELSYAEHVGQFEQSFEDKLISMYQSYVETYENEEYLLDTELTETKYGLHIIQAEKGIDFEQPSAKFAMTYDDNDTPEYLPGLVNTTDELTFEQLKIYADYRFMELAGDKGDVEAMYGLEEIDIPTKVLDAFEAYFQVFYDSTYVVGFMNDIIINSLSDFTWDSDSQYITVSQADFLESCDIIADVLMYQVYEPYDHREDLN